MVGLSNWVFQITTLFSRHTIIVVNRISQRQRLKSYRYLYMLGNKNILLIPYVADPPWKRKTRKERESNACAKYTQYIKLGWWINWISYKSFTYPYVITLRVNALQPSTYINILPQPAKTFLHNGIKGIGCVVRNTRSWRRWKSDKHFKSFK